MRKKAIIARVFDAAGVLSVVRRTSGRRKPWLRALCYHRIYDLAASDECDPELVSATPEDFHWQMKYLRDNFDVLGEGSLLDCVRGKIPWPHRPVVVTFDDGFVDNHSIALPILKTAGCEALFFIATGYMNARERFWYEWVQLVLKHHGALPTDALEQLGLARSEPGVDDDRSKEILLKLRALSNDVRLRFLGYLAEHTGIRRDEFFNERHRPMRWHEVKDLARANMGVGGHSVSHPVLSKLTTEQLEMEVRGARDDIEQQLIRPCRTFAYPFGGQSDVSGEVIDRCAVDGYEVAFTLVSGGNDLPLGNPFTLKRFAVERYLSRSEFRGILELPQMLAYIG